jgi:hypothetical protein
MSWLEVEPHQRWSGEVSVDALWCSIDVQPIEGTPPAVARYLAELRQVYVNGGAEFARFTLRGNPEFDWFASQGRWREISFFERLLVHPAVRQALPEVTASAKPGKAVEFEQGFPLTLDGVLAGFIVSGGAYRKFAGPPREAKQLGMEVCNALFGDRYLEVELFQCWEPWSSWFCDVAWDSTLILIDRRYQSVSLLCATDTD